eukprot:gnl/Dysnectes_brevis/1550_a1758_1417.p1 GENE.gnl/Dysnectes_brevis/1550_a1758_1417~~gnl/Dysnectes_brevis/1550_a1758_1417.p1  ORF type:complete len:748 (-),score=272.48 gnl/Dysnectes_brevis/1550_a1758_1417:765-2978(-)
MTENSRASLTEALPEHLQKIMSEAQALKTSTTASRVSSPLPQEEDVLVDRRHSRRLSQVFTSDDLGSDQTDQTEEVEEQEEQTKIEQFDFSQQPKYIVSGHLRRYQLDGLAWLANLYTKNISGILADEMGLGKTLQSISLFAWIYEQYQIRGPHMVVAPKSTLGQWHDEMAKWCPFLTPLVLIGDKEERAEILKRVRAKDFDVLITSNEVCKIEKSTLLRIHWRTLVVDEGHRLKNPESETSKVLSRFKTHFRLLLTGTPLQNNLHELWALLNFIMPETFQTAESFTAIARQREGESPDLPVKRLHAVLRPFILRRLKADVETLPPKREINVLCGLSATQRDLYRGILAKDISSLVGDGVGRSRLRNIVMQLRKCVNHPYLFSGIEPGPPYVEGEHLVKSSGKLMLLDALLTRLKDEGSRVLLFSQMTSVLNILEDYCHLRNHQYVRLDGQTSLEDRNRYMRRFNAPNSPIFYALQTKVERTLSAIENKMQQDPDLQFDTTLHCDPTLPGLNEKELKTFKGLLEVGSPFHRWNRREFQALFGALCELDIKEDWEELAERVRAKGCTQSDEDIRRYADAILKNIGTFTEADRMRTRFQKGQQRRKKHAAKIRTLRRHVAAYADPFAMALPTVTRNKNSFNEVEDRFLLAQTVKEGYGEWAQVLAAARLSPLFTFDWWFKSRTPGEINRRVEALVRGLQKMEVSVGVRRTAGTAGLETKTARPKKKRQLTLDAFKSDKK